MQLNTRHFGYLEINEDKIVTFNHGIPGFPEDKRYIIVTDEDAPGNAYCWLQSADDGDVVLALIDSFVVMPKYNPLVDEGEMEELGEVDLSDIAVFNVAVIGETMAASTVNLKAPIVINERTRKGKQVIVKNEEYDIRHSLLECLNNKGEI